MPLSFEQIRELVRNALELAHNIGQGAWIYIVDQYDDEVVYEIEGQTAGDGPLYYRRSYTIVDDEVELGEPTRVERKVEYVQVEASLILVAAAEGDAGSGEKWRVQVVEFGEDLNGNWWDSAVLAAHLSHFEGAQVFCLTEAQHQARPHPFGKSVKDLVGWLENVEATNQGIEADLVLTKAAAWLGETVLDAWNRGKKDLVGLSVDITGTVGKKKVNGKSLPTLTAIRNVTVDVVYDPAAGGKFLRMAAARAAGETEDTMLEKLLAALKAKRPDLYQKIQSKIDDGSITEDEAIEQITAAMQSPAPEFGEEFRAAVAGIVADEMARNMPTGNDPAQAESEALRQTKLLACKLMLRDELAGSGLPELAQDKIRKRFEGEVFEIDALRAAITEEKEFIDQLTASGIVEGAGGVAIVLDQRDKVDQYLDDFFEGAVSSIKSAYVDITGDAKFTGQIRAAKRLTASIASDTFAEALGDAITRRMLKEYNASGLDDWRKIVEVVPAQDFRTQHRPRIGGYGDLPTVAQSGDYTALTSPGDEEATYAVSKKGGTEDVTLEAIRNDDVAVIRRIPRKLARAAARTLYKFVFSFLDSNPTIYDGVALFHASHGNLGAAALDGTGLKARRLALMKQQEADSNEPLGIPPMSLVVPVDLEDTAYELTVQPNVGQFQPEAADAVRRQTWTIIPVKTWTDANNWYLVADPADIPTIEIAFLDGNETPELFVQDMPNVGSMFSNDKLTYKIRHIYGGAVMDFRGFDGSIVV